MPWTWETQLKPDLPLVCAILLAMEQSQAPDNLRPRVFPPENRETNINSDLGLGRVVAEQNRGRFINKDGRFNSRRLGLGWWASLNPYHWLLTISWPAFFALITLAYLLINFLFAGLFLWCGPWALQGTVSGVMADPFWRSFFFSVETFSTIGYGHVFPVSMAANILVTVESFVGLVGVALATGLLFARFARPVTRILFSHRALVSPYQDGTGLMFRVTNGLRNDLIELSAQVNLSRFETVNGARVRRFYTLDLERSKVAFFPLAWTVVHPITQDSPLWGVSEQDLLESEAEFLVILAGLDDTLFQPIHARNSYKAEEVVWRAKFSTMYVKDRRSVAIDVNRLNLFEPAE